MTTPINVEPVRQFLSAVGFTPAAIEVGIAALSGKPPAPAATQAEEPLLSPKELSKRMGISLTTLWRLKPPYMRVGARKRFIWSEIQTFLKEGSVTT
jgi:hypothetical protein